MARPKGDGRGRLGGRQAGTPNKETQIGKQYINDFIAGYWNTEKMKSDFELLSPKERLYVILKLLEHVVPKMQATSVDLTTRSDNEISITQQLITLAQLPNKKE